jgi:hypothetical protein
MVQVIDCFFPLSGATPTWGKVIPSALPASRVLFVEEDEDFFDLLHPTFESSAEVIYAASADEGHRYLSSHRIDLVVIDCNPEKFREVVNTLAEGRISAQHRWPLLLLSAHEPESFPDLNAQDPFFLVGHIRKNSFLHELIEQLSEKLHHNTTQLF